MASSETNNSNRPSNVRGSNRDLVGIAFPFQRGNGEFPMRVRNVACVSNDLLLLFKTPLRSRVMRPLVGTKVWTLVFEGTGPLLQARINRAVLMPIARQEPRVKARAISISEKDTLVDTTIYYTVQGVKQDLDLEIPKGVSKQ